MARPAQPLLRLVAMPEDLVARIAQRYFDDGVRPVVPPAPPAQDAHDESSDESLWTFRYLAAQGPRAVFFCHFCNVSVRVVDVAAHVRSAAHVATRDEVENAPGEGCCVVLHGRPMLLDCHCVFPDVMFGAGAFLFDDTVGALALPDVTGAVDVAHGHEYTVVRFALPRDAPPSRSSDRARLHTDSAENRYFAGDFGGGGVRRLPVDSTFSRVRERRQWRELGLVPGAHETDATNAAAIRRAIRRADEVRAAAASAGARPGGGAGAGAAVGAARHRTVASAPPLILAAASAAEAAEAAGAAGAAVEIAGTEPLVPVARQLAVVRHAARTERERVVRSFAKAAERVLATKRRHRRTE